MRVCLCVCVCVCAQVPVQNSLGEYFQELNECVCDQQGCIDHVLVDRTRESRRSEPFSSLMSESLLVFNPPPVNEAASPASTLTYTVNDQLRPRPIREGLILMSRLACRWEFR